jgi:DNA repair exonuclease SbcCD ATPase subunit
MSESATVSTGAERRTIGAILRSHGYVTDAQLEQAARVQASTGKPLGQVLVEAGAITRLDLASALAEQWSDSSDWMHSSTGDTFSDRPPDARSGIGLTVQRHELGDGALASRLDALDTTVRRLLESESTPAPLEHAVADLARRLTTLEPTLAELERHADAAVDADALESHLAELAATIEAVTDRSIGTAADVSRFSSEVAALRDLATQAEAALTVQDVVELRTQVEELASRPVVDVELTARVGELAASIQALSARPAVDPGTAERLDHLTAEVAGLAADQRIAELQSKVADLAAQPREGTELADGIEELARRIDALVVEAGARVQGDIPDELRLAVEELASRPAPDAALKARVDELARQMSERPSNGEVQELRDALTASTSRFEERIHELSDRVSELSRSSKIEDIRRFVDELAARPPGDPELAERVRQLAERVDTAAATTAARTVDRAELEDVSGRLDELAQRLADTTAELTARATAPPPLDPEKVATLEARLDELDQRLAELPAQGAADGDSGPMAEELALRVEGTEHAAETLSAELSRTAEIWYAGRAALEAQLEQLESRIASRPPQVGGARGDEPPPQTHVVEQEVERVLMAVERLGLHLSEHDRALAELLSRRGPSKVEELAARIDELEMYGVAAGAVVVGAPPGSDGAPAPVSLAETRDLRAELRSLSRQVTELEDTSRSEREKFLTQLERMASSIDWRIRRIESGESTP